MRITIEHDENDKNLKIKTSGHIKMRNLGWKWLNCHLYLFIYLSDTFMQSKLTNEEISRKLMKIM